MAVTHRMIWKGNLASFVHVLKKRSCWISEMGFWTNVVQTMVEDLARVIHPKMRTLVAPPCIDTRTDKFKGCVFDKEMAGAITGEYPQLPCPLYFNKHPDRVAAVALTVKGEEPPKWRVHLHPHDPYSVMRMQRTGETTEQLEQDVARIRHHAEERSRLWGHDMKWEKRDAADEIPARVTDATGTGGGSGHGNNGDPGLAR
jgi:hypothetical protein